MSKMKRVVSSESDGIILIAESSKDQNRLNTKAELLFLTFFNTTPRMKMLLDKIDIDEWMDGQTDEWIDGWMDEWMDGWVDTDR